MTPVDRLSATNLLRIVIILPQRNQDAISNLVQDIYDPSSTNFHRYLTPAQFNERFAPANADYQTVIGFAKTHGLTVTRTVPGRTIVEVDAAVADIEKAMHVTLHLYQHPTEPRQFFAPDVEPSLDLEVPVLVVRGLNNYAIPHHISHIGNGGTPATAMGGSFPWGTSNSIYMASDIRHAYVPGTPLTGAGQVLGLMEFDGYTPADITAYEATNGLPNVHIQEVFVGWSGPNNPNNGDPEPGVDIDMAIAMAPGLSEVVFYYGNNNPHADSMLTEMADPTQGEPLPLQLSSSWGYPLDAITDTAFVRFAVQGQSFFGVSGDGGSYPMQAHYAQYVTAVGGTELAMSGLGASWSNETVWGNGQPPGTGEAHGSGGGIVTNVPIPAYQQPVNMTAVGGSPVWRNLPDVAMVSDNLMGFLTGTDGVQQIESFSGTSFSTPLWAGFTALVNEQAAALKQGPVGFLNPALYAIGLGPNYSSCFHDVTVGNNTWSNSPGAYFAAPGYDLCTGWGSPKGASLINLLARWSGAVWVDFNYTGSLQTGSFTNPYPTLAKGTNAVASGGTIFIKTAGSSPETMTISKPMTINAIGGAATIGHQ